jgi:hypothetical protein
MNSPEKIAGVYLRLNGFFLLPQFTLFDGQRHTHVDLLGLRSPGSMERCKDLIFPLDDHLFEHVEGQVEDSRNQLIAIIAEVKGNQEKENPGEGHYEYINHFLGNSNQIKIHFRDQGENISTENDVIEVPLKHALKWIIERIEFIDENKAKLSKEGSWSWSEMSLSDILYIKKLGFLRILE